MSLSIYLIALLNITPIAPSFVLHPHSLRLQPTFVTAFTPTAKPQEPRNGDRSNPLGKKTKRFSLGGKDENVVSIWPFPRVGILLACQKPPPLLPGLMQFWQQDLGGIAQGFPWLIAEAAGPLTLDNGLRVLANYYLPVAERPDILVIVTNGENTFDPALVAYVRSCAQADLPLAILGKTFPSFFQDLPLVQGRSIPLLDQNTLPTWLSHTTRQILAERSILTLTISSLP